MASDNYNVNFSFLEKSENFATKGYVPSCTAKSIANSNPVCSGKKVGDAIGQSGMTIGTGVDLGQMNEYDLKRLKLPEQLQTTLKPFLTKKGEAAQKLTLELTATDARLLSNKVKDVIISQVVNAYEKDSNSSFNALSQNIQTAVVDYFYQYGPNAMQQEAHKNFWEHIIQHKWKEAVDFLLNKEEYKGRRTDEANLLSTAPEFQ